MLSTSTWMERWLQDVRYAVRTIRRAPGLAAVVVLTLSIAIGMNTAILSVFNAVVWRPLGYPHADRLVWLSTVGIEAEAGIVTGPDFVEWRERATSFERMAAYGTTISTLTSVQGATRVRTANVTEDFWDLAGATPTAGRVPDASAHDEVALVASRVARRWFAGDADAIGRTVTMDGRSITIVGVLPETFRFHLPGSPWTGPRPGDIDIYVPMKVSSARGGPMQILNVVARLKPGMTIERGRGEIEAIRASRAQAHPNAIDDQRTLRVVPLHDQLIGGARLALLVLLAAAAFVLLIACANAANLLLARASIRRKEIAVRLAVGAGQGRVLRQLFVESLALALMASAAGLLIARAGVAAILGIDPQAMPRLAEATIDGRILAVVLGVSVLTALLFGVAPAVALMRTDPHEALQAGSRVASPVVAGVRARWILVAGEVALALMLLIGAGLMVKSAWRLNAYPPGFEPQRILRANLEFAGPRYAEPHQQIAFVDTLLAALQAAPGVEAASVSTHGYHLTSALMVDGEPVPAADELARKPPIMINATSTALRQVMGLRLMRGRWFSEGEPAIVLNEHLARRDFAGRDPIGLRIRLNESGPQLTIVGVVADLKYSKSDASAEPEVYVPYTRLGDGLFGFTALVRTTGDPLVLAPSVRRLISEIDKTQVPDAVTSLEQALADSIAPRRLNLLLLGTFAVSAFFLPAIGIYGVMAYAVTQRRHEIGVRMALGAQRTTVVQMVLRQGLRVTLAGIVVGVGGALMLTRVMESLLYEVRPTDSGTFAVMTTALAMTGIVACGIPALNAARVDPMITLRDE